MTDIDVVYEPIIIEIDESGLADLASEAEAIDGVSQSKLIVPATMRSAFTSWLSFLIPETGPVARVSRVWCGGVTDSAFVVAFDVFAAVPCSLLVSTSANMSNPVTVGPITPVATPGVNSNYFPVKLTVTGRAPRTRYYYQIVVGDAPESKIYSVRTFPTRGQPANAKIVFSSCLQGWSNKAPDTVFSAIAKEDPDLMISLGDTPYCDISVNDIRVSRDQTSRIWRGNPDFIKMCETIPISYMWSDHDSAGDDNSWDKVYASGATNEQILRNGRKVYRETLPHYPFVQQQLGETDIDKVILTQVIDIGRVRIFLLDDRSQRRYPVTGVTYDTPPAPTYLGHNSGHEYWDQFSWFAGAMQSAKDDGVKLVLFTTGSCWTAASLDAYSKYAPAEQTAICDVIRGLDTPAILLSADSHNGGADDGQNTDFSTARDSKWPQLAASPFHQANTTDGGPFYWSGVKNNVYVNNTQYGVLSITDDGSTISWGYQLKGNPIDPDTYASTVLVDVSSASRAPVMKFNQTSLKIPTGETPALTLIKDGFGMGPSSVNWYTSNGQNGTASFKPNRNSAPIGLTALSSSITLTLASPSGGTIGGTNPITIAAYTPQTETSAWRTAYNAVAAASVTHEDLATVDKLITDLKSAGLWSKLARLYRLCGVDGTGAFIDLKNPATSANKLVLHDDSTDPNAPFMTFVRNQGWKHVGTSTQLGYLSTGYYPDTGGGIAQDNNHIGIHILEDYGWGGGEIGGANFLFNPCNTSNSLVARNASATSNNVANAATAARYVLSRTASGTYGIYKNGALFNTVSQASSALTHQEFWICGWGATAGAQYGRRRVAWAHWGAGLTAGEVATLDGILAAHNAAIGMI